jgi:RNA polymerase sigma-70 factor, ECF subfamily
LERSIKRVQTQPDSNPDSKAVVAWIQAAQSGDGEAFDRLAHHYLPRIRRWALVRTGDPDEADDVVQRTLVQMYRKIGGFRGAATFGSWLYRITANAALGRFRHGMAQERLLDRLRSQPEDATSPFESEPEGNGSLEALVWGFLVELSVRQREMMDLVDFQEYTPSEAAHMLGLNPNTARVHLLRARRRVRNWILEAHPTVVEGLR